MACGGSRYFVLGERRLAFFPNSVDTLGVLSVSEKQLRLDRWGVRA